MSSRPASTVLPHCYTMNAPAQAEAEGSELHSKTPQPLSPPTATSWMQAAVKASPTQFMWSGVRAPPTSPSSPITPPACSQATLDKLFFTQLRPSEVTELPLACASLSSLVSTITETSSGGVSGGSDGGGGEEQVDERVQQWECWRARMRAASAPSIPVMLSLRWRRIPPSLQDRSAKVPTCMRAPLSTEAATAAGATAPITCPRRQRNSFSSVGASSWTLRTSLQPPSSATGDISLQQRSQFTNKSHLIYSGRSLRAAQLSEPYREERKRRRSARKRSLERYVWEQLARLHPSDDLFPSHRRLLQPVSPVPAPTPATGPAAPAPTPATGPAGEGGSADAHLAPKTPKSPKARKVQRKNNLQKCQTKSKKIAELKSSKKVGNHREDSDSNNRAANSSSLRNRIAEENVPNACPLTSTEKKYLGTNPTDDNEGGEKKLEEVKRASNFPDSQTRSPEEDSIQLIKNDILQQILRGTKTITRKNLNNKKVSFTGRSVSSANSKILSPIQETKRSCVSEPTTPTKKKWSTRNEENEIARRLKVGHQEFTNTPSPTPNEENSSDSTQYETKYKNIMKKHSNHYRDSKGHSNVISSQSTDTEKVTNSESSTSNENSHESNIINGKELFNLSKDRELRFQISKKGCTTTAESSKQCTRSSRRHTRSSRDSRNFKHSNDQVQKECDNSESDGSCLTKTVVTKNTTRNTRGSSTSRGLKTSGNGPFSGTTWHTIEVFSHVGSVHASNESRTTIVENISLVDDLPANSINKPSPEPPKNTRRLPVSKIVRTRLSSKKTKRRRSAWRSRAHTNVQSKATRPSPDLEKSNQKSNNQLRKRGMPKRPGNKVCTKKKKISFVSPKKTLDKQNIQEHKNLQRSGKSSQPSEKDLGRSIEDSSQESTDNYSQLGIIRDDEFREIYSEFSMRGELQRFMQHEELPEIRRPNYAELKPPWPDTYGTDVLLRPPKRPQPDTRQLKKQAARSCACEIACRLRALSTPQPCCKCQEESSTSKTLRYIRTRLQQERLILQGLRSAKGSKDAGHQQMATWRLARAGPVWLLPPTSPLRPPTSPLRRESLLFQGRCY